MCNRRALCITLDLILMISIFTLTIIGLLSVTVSKPVMNNKLDQLFVIGICMIIGALALFVIWIGIIYFRGCKYPHVED